METAHDGDDTPTAFGFGDAAFTGRDCLGSDLDGEDLGESNRRDIGGKGLACMQAGGIHFEIDDESN